ncbi:bacteriohemerythrin [Magnetovibrio blakemorei]|nr:hemerythrin family protein [Magnetovibrio blakemorei]
MDGHELLKVLSSNKLGGHKMTIEWNDKLSVGNEAIDEDHKHLVKLINAYEKAVSENNLKVLGLAFTALEKYAHEHFEREEKIQQAVHYPHRNSHREAHKALLQAVEAKHKQIENHEKINIEELSSFLRSWLIDHVVKEDMKLKPYLTGGRTQ